MDIAVPATPEVSIIVPARNEEVCLGDCLTSLAAQMAVAFEIIVVDDGSTDRTRAIAESFAGVRVIFPEPLHENLAGKTWTGKNNALVAGAKKERADLLSYSPEQVVVTFAERAVLPVIFAELAARYPPHKVRDEASKIVAANG